MTIGAACQCGQLAVTVPGPTFAVVACHCQACQKRSGSPFGQAAFYPHAAVAITGQAKRFTRPTSADGQFDQFFCPDCGTTVYMRGTKNPEMTGIPIGLFTDPQAMKPVLSVWEDHRHSWVEITTAMKRFPQGRVD